MEIACKSLLLLTVFVCFLILTGFSDGRATNPRDRDAKSGNRGKFQAKGVGKTRVPVVDYTSLEEPVEYPNDPYGSLSSMYLPSFAGGGPPDTKVGKDGLNAGLLFYGYPQGYYGGPYGFGYGYPYQGGIFGFPRGTFGFPQGIFGFPRNIWGFPRGIFGFPGGYGGVPGGYGVNPGGYGGNPGGYGGGQPGPGIKPGGGGGYPGYGGKAEVKSKEVDHHD